MPGKNLILEFFEFCKVNKYLKHFQVFPTNKRTFYAFTPFGYVKDIAQPPPASSIILSSGNLGLSSFSFLSCFLLRSRVE